MVGRVLEPQLGTVRCVLSLCLHVFTRCPGVAPAPVPWYVKGWCEGSGNEKLALSGAEKCPGD